MELEDRLELTTPEGLTLELTLAGLGSRAAASLLDWLIRLGLFFGFAVVGGLVGDAGGSGWSVAFAIVAIFLVIFFYDVIFETTNRGQTPGKFWTGLRVVDREGGPVRFVPSAIRNLLRLIDFLPALYLVGTVAIIASSRHQRLGDIVAGTLVVRERRTTPPPAWVHPAWPQAQGWADPYGQGWAPAPPPRPAGWDVASITAEELATIRRFLERRDTLLPEARARLAEDLAARLYPKVSAPESFYGAEHFLERLLAVASGW